MSLEKSQEITKPSISHKISLLSAGENPDVNVVIGCVTHEGLYHSNEDRMCFGVQLNKLVEGYVGVFDGHGGQECAEFVSSKLSQYLATYFKEKADWTDGDNKMKTMFHQIEEDFTKIASEEEDTSGSCATVVIVHGSDALVANIGDIKAIAVPHDQLSPDDYMILTGDHRADADDEMERIQRAGGSVVEGRVYNLQPSRSFGDLDVKEVVGDNIVIPTPEVRSVRITSGGFLIVATDGVWDSVADDTVVESVKKFLKESNDDVVVAAEQLVELALKNDSTDDITVSILLWKEN